jgi:hypothetical protein
MKNVMITKPILYYWNFDYAFFDKTYIQVLTQLLSCHYTQHISLLFQEE